MSDLNSLTLAEARDGLKKRSFSALELADAHLAAMEKARALNAYILETPERASAMAKAADARIAAGKAGPLEGIPLAVKDMFCTEGVRSTACAHVLERTPSVQNISLMASGMPSSGPALPAAMRASDAFAMAEARSGVSNT